jgi:histidine triad (HIT) family protein
MEDCIFCKIVNGELPSTKVYEDGEFLGFMNIFPATKGHVLLIPKKHVRWMQDAPDALVSTAFVLTKNMMSRMITEIGCDYVQVTVMGEQVEHFHIHLIPRYFDQKLPSWTPITYSSDEEMQEYARKIKAH